jgi:hypothetical protein
LTVEDKSVGAGQTDLVLPVPSSTTNVSHILDGSEDALSTLKVVANVAAQACTSSVKGIALAGNSYTYAVSVEHPVVGALETFLVLPVPGSTTSISNSLDGGLNALSVLQVVSNITRKACSGSVEGLALIRDRHTNSVSVKNPVVRTLKTFLVLPVPQTASSISHVLSGGLNTLSVG